MSLAEASQIVKQPEVTRDAFLGGRLIVTQPTSGFRAGLDSVLLGAAVSPGGESLLDLGAGVGTAALVALAHDPEITATLVETDADAAALAAANLGANGFAIRAAVTIADVTAPGARRVAGLRADAFGRIIANPPFFEGTPASRRGAAARQMPAAAIDVWVKAAATHAMPGGEAIFIHTAERLRELLDAFAARFGALTVLPLTPREGEPAHRVLVRGVKGSRAPLTLLASRPLHAQKGRGFRPEFEAIFRGEDALHW
ncbi:MAG: methyltransferase [Devosia sp.]